jgi:ketosteroid isomerase-like protein
MGRQSGVEIVRELAGVYRIRNGLIASERVYLDRDEALDAAGLRQ